MAKWKLVRLKFGRTPVHFGEVGIGMEESRDRARSDTLFSGWINAYARLFGKDAVERLLDDAFLAKSPQIAMSSTFLYHQDRDKYTYYLPKPLAFPQSQNSDNNPLTDDLVLLKEYKKRKQLPLEIWKKWYRDRNFEKSDLTAEKLKSDIQLTKTDTLPKVALDRNTSASNFYHTGFSWFRYESDTDYAGLYFLIRFEKENNTSENLLKAALYLLGEEGIGGERSSGAGRFEVEYWGNLPQEWQELVKESQDNKYYCLVSLWGQEHDKKLPSDWSEGARYELIERGGWVGSPFSGRQVKRKKVTMFAEGSVFKYSPQGQLVNVTPDNFNRHQIYRNGIALSLPIAIKS